MSPARVLFHSPGRRGLGHVMRSANLARAILRVDPTAAVLVDVANAASGLACGADVPWCAGDGERAAHWSGLVAGFRPSLAVFDTILPGPWADDRIPRAFVWRHSVEARHRETQADRRLADMRLIVVPHGREEFGYDLPAGLRARTVFTGPIVRTSDAAGRARVRARYALHPYDVVLTTTMGGGGFADSAWLYEAVVAAHTELRNRIPGLRHLVVRGPLAAGARPMDVAGMTIVDADADLVHLLALSALVVAEAGYNTVQEIRQIGVPAVLVPGPRRYDDQSARAHSLEVLGVARVVQRTSRQAAAAAIVALACDSAALARMRHRAGALRPTPGNDDAAVALLAAAR